MIFAFQKNKLGYAENATGCPVSTAGSIQSWTDPLLLGSELHACSYAVESLNGPLEGCQEGGTLRQGTFSPLLPQAVFWLLSL